MCEFDEMTTADINEYNRRERDEKKNIEPEEDVCIDCGSPTDDPDYEYCTECLIARAETKAESRLER